MGDPPSGLSTPSCGASLPQCSILWGIAAFSPNHFWCRTIGCFVEVVLFFIHCWCRTMGCFKSTRADLLWLLLNQRWCRTIECFVLSTAEEPAFASLADHRCCRTMGFFGEVGATLALAVRFRTICCGIQAGLL